MDNLKQDFRAACVGIYRNAKNELNYNATIFKQMISSPDDIVSVARRLIHKPEGTTGLWELCSAGRPDLTMEYMILTTPKYHPLFIKEDLEQAYYSLQQHGCNMDGIEKP